VGRSNMGIQGNVGNCGMGVNFEKIRKNLSGMGVEMEFCGRNCQEVGV